MGQSNAVGPTSTESSSGLRSIPHDDMYTQMQPSLLIRDWLQHAWSYRPTEVCDKQRSVDSALCQHCAVLIDA